MLKLVLQTCVCYACCVSVILDGIVPTHPRFSRVFPVLAPPCSYVQAFLASGGGAFITVTSEVPLREGKWADVVLTYKAENPDSDGTMTLYVSVCL